MKHTMYFSTKADMERYFPNGVPSSVLAIVESDGGLYTSSNNDSSGGGSQEQGGEPISEQDREYVDWTLEGEPEPEPELEDGWYAHGDTGDLYPFNMVKTGMGVIEVNDKDGFNDFPCYFINVIDGEMTSYYTQHDYDWADLDNTALDPNSDNYSNNRVTKEDNYAGDMTIDWSIDHWEVTTNLM